MKILVLSDTDTGGAGSAALRLHTVLQKSGHRSALLVRRKTTTVPGVVSVYGGILRTVRALMLIADKLIQRIQRVFNVVRPSLTDPKYYFFNLDGSTEHFSSPSLLSKIPFRPDVIVSCFIGKFINVKTIAELQKLTGAAVVWYLFDMGFLTGGCHYAWECTGYKERCGRCPALYSAEQDDWSRKNLELKLELTRDKGMTVVAGSDRLYRQCLESSVCRGNSIHKVLLSVDPGIFRPGDREAAKRSFGLPPGKRIIFAGSSDLSEERKGTRYLLRTLEELKIELGPEHANVMIMLAGSARGFPLDQLCFEYKHVGILEGDRQLLRAYLAADVYVCTSVEDSGPMMINESLMCGTPVVSFDMGVARDLVIDRETGFCVALRDSNAMASGLKRIINLNDQEYAGMRERCRNLAIQACHPDAQAKAFGAIFAQLRGAVAEPAF